MKSPKPNQDTRSPASDALPGPLVAQALEKTQIAKYHTGGGLGFAAEDANNFADTVHGKRAVVVGISNELNGADRVVDGLLIQSKYYRTAAETIKASFDPDSGTYRYSGQVLEVPKDQYEACVELMQGRIARGKVPGYDNPADADKIIQQGTVTYKQARNIARAGNIDSLFFDAKTQSVTCTYVFAASFAVTFAQGRWRGESTKDAIKGAVGTALSAGGATLAIGIVSAQALRTKAAAIGVVSVRGGVKAVARTAIGREAIHRVAAGSLGRAVYGAAAVNHISKLVRSNALTGTIAAVASSTPDFYRAVFARSISWRQFTKNVSVNIAGVASGTLGWMAGAALGASLGRAIPFAGTAIGGVVGGILGAVVGGVGGSATAKAIADLLVDDDSKSLVTVLEEEIQGLAFEYMLTEAEVERVGDEARRVVKPSWLRSLFKESRQGADRGALRSLIRRAFEPYFESLVRERGAILLPPPDDVEAEVIGLAKAVETTE